MAKKRTKKQRAADLIWRGLTIMHSLAAHILTIDLDALEDLLNKLEALCKLKS